MPATAARDRDAKRIGGRILSWDFLLAIREGARGGGAQMKTPGVDQIPSRQVMRIKKNINKGIIS